jgi:hypothetical protein
LAICSLLCFQMNFKIGWLFNLCDVWWELHWISKLLLIVYPFLLCWFYQSMSIGDLSIFCSLSRALSSGVCSSPCRGHPHPLLSLFLCIWFFWGYCKWNCFHIFFLNFFIVGV